MAYIGQAPASAIVSSNDIANNAITSAKIADGTVVASDILDGTVTNAKLVDYTVASTKMANSGVTAALYGGSTAIPVITIDGAGRITSAANTSLTLGTIATQDADNVSITGGSISGSNISGGNVYGAGLKVTTVSSSTNVTTLNYSNGSVFKSTATENTTITPSNMPEQEGIMLLKLTNGGAYTISFAGNCAFIGNTAPTLTTSGTDFLFIQGNATHYAVFTQLDVR